MMKRCEEPKAKFIR